MSGGPAFRRTDDLRAGAAPGALDPGRGQRSGRRRRGRPRHSRRRRAAAGQTSDIHDARRAVINAMNPDRSSGNSGVVRRKSSAALTERAKPVRVRVTAQSVTCRPNGPCRSVVRTVSSMALWKARGSEPGSTARRNVVPAPARPWGRLRFRGGRRCVLATVYWVRWPVPGAVPGRISRMPGAGVGGSASPSGGSMARRGPWTVAVGVDHDGGEVTGRAGRTPKSDGGEYDVRRRWSSAAASGYRPRSPAG